MIVKNNQMLKYASCVVCGLGFFLLFVATLRGNWLIFAGPIALWAVVVVFPSVHHSKGKKCFVSSRRPRGIVKAQGNILSWRLFLVVAVWLAASIALWPKVIKTTVSDTQISTAMQRAAALFEAGKYEEALVGFWMIEIPDCFPNRRAQKYHNIGLIQVKLGKAAEAEAAFRRAVSYDPKDIDAYYLLACIAYEAKQYSKAMNYLRDGESHVENGMDLPRGFELLKARLQESSNAP